MLRAGRKDIFIYQPSINEENKLRREGEEESRAPYIQEVVLVVRAGDNLEG